MHVNAELADTQVKDDDEQRTLEVTADGDAVPPRCSRHRHRGDGRRPGSVLRSHRRRGHRRSRCPAPPSILPGPSRGTFDAAVDVGVSAPSWTGDGDDIPFRQATLSGVGTIDDPTVLSFAIDGASPTNLYFGRNASDDGFDDAQKRHRDGAGSAAT